MFYRTLPTTRFFFNPNVQRTIHHHAIENAERLDTRNGAGDRCPTPGRSATVQRPGGWIGHDRCCDPGNDNETGL